MNDPKDPEAAETDQTTEPEAVAPAADCYAADERPWWKRKVCRLFGHHPMLPDLPEWAKDGIITDVRINFSFWDRLQIFLHGNASVRVWTAVENIPGRAESSSHAMAGRPSFLA